MIGVCEEQGQLFISRNGSIRVIRIQEHRGAVRQMIMRLQREGRVQEFSSLDEMRTASGPLAVT